VSVKEIVSEWLKKNGCDGLVNEDAECGCEASDMMPCESSCGDCEAAYRVRCGTDSCECGSCDDNGWHMSKNDPRQQALPLKTA